MLNKQALKEQLLQSNIDYSIIKVGENNFYDTEWRIKNQKGKVNFNLWNELPVFREQVRLYLLYVYKDNTFSTVLAKLDALNFFFKFVKEKYTYFKDFEDINNIILNDYLNYTLNFKSKRGNNGEYDENGEYLSKTSLNRRTQAIENILKLASKNDLFKIDEKLILYYEKQRRKIILNSPRVQNKNSKPTTKKEYKIETIKNIIKCAYEDEDMYLKTALFIQTQCGLRIDEVLSIEDDAILGKAGSYRLRYTTTKTKKGSVVVEKPINDIAAELVLDLIKFTEEPRKRLNTKRIFVISKRVGSGVTYAVTNYKYLNNKEYPVNSTVFIRKDNFNRDFVKPFVKRWDIREDGELVELSTHYFRHFFAHLSWLHDCSVQTIRDMLNHESYTMTATYMYNAENSMREKFKIMMNDPSKMKGKSVGNYQEKLTNRNIFKGKTEKQLDAIIGVMNIKILSNGACMHHPLKADKTLSQCEPNCLKCDRYVTHECYLEVHKKRVRRLNVIMDDSLKKGRQRWYERNKAERDYIIENFIKPFDSECEEVNSL